ncbi:uncharacterized protein LOC135837253 [Planococcus citri]|uniref:uncharacterized protein LOC135837253 n=1 Tax=Planococcus citri TaxID=170843 RepID=UPI0031F8AA52
MLMKFYFVSIWAAASFCFIVRATQIPTSKCMKRGWELCNIHQIDISPADRTVEDRSCSVDRGSNVTVAFNFTPRFETYNLKWGVWVETMIGDYKVEGIPEDAHDLTNYPTIENKINEFKSVIHIPDTIRAKLWVVRVTITGDDEHDVCCFTCQIRVRESQQITKSPSEFDPNNPYDILRQRVSFPSIWDFNDVVKNFQNNTDLFNKFVFGNAPTTRGPGFWSFIQNGFRKLIGLSYKTYKVTTPKIPFLGNASSFMEYMNDVIKQNGPNQDDQFDQNTATNTVDIETVETSPTETESVSEIDEITKETIFDDITTTETIPTSSVTEAVEEPVNESKIDVVDSKSANEEETEPVGSNENDCVEEQTTTPLVETTQTKRKTTIRKTSVKRKTISRSGSKKVSNVGTTGIKKTVKRIALRNQKVNNKNRYIGKCKGAVC